ncbi:APC family permease [Sphingobacterium rhinopitheci]|uniref:APC family permease n=1 Tax=Sphingobacterium rhinopitheci TaxID=2781960 RepID=UPI001F515D72|nr:APC family permease [Sphingobacterium rhinopitheci]MCI0922564.1 amino acid permease [Sphingobacterium rhinopitheci]
MSDNNQTNLSSSNPAPKKGRITVISLTLMIAAAVTSLRGVPIMSQEELTMFVYLIFAAILFLVPAALVSAELGTAFADQGGGVYTWVKEAFNKRTGFVAVFLQWMQNVVWYPTTLAFGAAAIAYIIDKPELASDGKFIGTFAILIYWISTFISFKGTGFISKISSKGFIFGTIVPLLTLIGLAIYWTLDGNPLAFNSIPAAQTEIAVTVNGVTEPRFIPHLSGIGNIVFLATIVLLFSGIEALAVHAAELDNPKKDYPKAMLIASVISFIILALGGLSVSVLLPYDQITLQAGVLESFKLVFAHYNISWMTNVLAVLVVVGCASCIISWLSGPSTALLYTAKDGELPKFMTKLNKNGIQTNILYVQGGLVTLLCALYFVLEDVSVAFFLLSSLTGALYLIMYMLMYLSGIRLRETQPNLPRAFKVPGGKYGMSVFGGLGFVAVAFAFVLCFIPPSQLPIDSPTVYTIFIVAGVFVFVLIPIVMSKIMGKKQTIN